MIRKVLMLALTAGVANKLYHHYRQKHGSEGMTDNKGSAGAHSRAAGPQSSGPGPMQ